MKLFLLKYKKNILQILGLIFGFILFNKKIFLYLAFTFLIIAIIFPKLYKKINIVIENIINYIGNSIKSLILAIVFILIINPISILLKIFSKKNNCKKEDTNYIILNNNFNKNNMKNMW